MHVKKFLITGLKSKKNLLRGFKVVLVISRKFFSVLKIFFFFRFSNFDESEYGLGYSISSSVRNISHDLLLLYRVKKLLNYRSDCPEQLQPIFDNFEYGDERALEAEEVRLGKSQWEYGSVEKIWY